MPEERVLEPEEPREANALLLLALQHILAIRARPRDRRRSVPPSPFEKDRVAQRPLDTRACEQRGLFILPYCPRFVLVRTP